MSLGDFRSDLEREVSDLFSLLLDRMGLSGI